MIVTCDMIPNSIPLESINKLEHSLNLYGDNTNRGYKTDKGEMHILRKGKMGNGSVGVYRLTDSSQEISEAVSKLTGNVKIL